MIQMLIYNFIIQKFTFNLIINFIDIIINYDKL